MILRRKHKAKKICNNKLEKDKKRRTAIVVPQSRHVDITAQFLKPAKLHVVLKAEECKGQIVKNNKKQVN